jgi:hypothetical protein
MDRVLCAIWRPDATSKHTYHLDLFDQPLQSGSLVLLLVLFRLLLLVPVHLLHRGVLDLVGGVLFDGVLPVGSSLPPVQRGFPAQRVYLVGHFGSALLEVHDRFRDLDVERLDDDLYVVGTHQSIRHLVQRLCKTKMHRTSHKRLNLSHTGSCSTGSEYLCTSVAGHYNIEDWSSPTNFLTASDTIV